MITPENTDALTLQQIANRIARMAHIRGACAATGNQAMRATDQDMIRELDTLAARAGRMMARCRGNIAASEQAGSA